MQSIEHSLRALLALVDPVERDPHTGAAVAVNEDLAACVRAAERALAEHDAAAPGGIPDLAAFVRLSLAVGVPQDCKAQGHDEYRAFYVIDVPDVSDPLSAATWAWDAVKNSSGPVWVVVSPDGGVTEIDLGE